MARGERIGQAVAKPVDGDAARRSSLGPPPESAPRDQAVDRLGGAACNGFRRVRGIARPAEVPR
jgi:hypothetical protein